LEHLFDDSSNELATNFFPAMLHSTDRRLGHVRRPETSRRTNDEVDFGFFYLKGTAALLAEKVSETASIQKFVKEAASIGNEAEVDDFGHGRDRCLAENPARPIRDARPNETRCAIIAVAT
jgi:hypothetical protein